MRVRYVAILSAVSLLMAGCQEENPAVSLEQAKKITATFEDSVFTPPPRTIDDIEAVLERDRPDPARIAELRARADAKIAASDPHARSDALLVRARAAYELGRIPRSRRDAEEALRLAREGGFDRYPALKHLRLIATLTGGIDELIRISEEMIDVAQTVRQGRLFTPYSMLAYNLAMIGDHIGAQRNIGAAKGLLSEAAGWQRGGAVAEWGDLWEAQVLVGEAGIEMSQGRNARAETLMKRCLFLLERWAASDTGKTYPEIARNSIPAYRGGPLVDSLVREGKLAEAEAMSRRALSTILKEKGRLNASTAFIMTSFARVIIEQDRLAEGERLARATVDTFKAVGAQSNSWRLSDAMALLADVLAAQGRWAEALAVFDEMEAGFAGDAAGRQRFVESRPTRALALLMTGRTERARTTLRSLVAEREADLGSHHYLTAELKGLYALALAASGDYDAALAQYKSAVPIILQRSRRVQRGLGGDATAVQDQREQLILNGYIAALARAGGESAAAEAFRIADAARSHAVQGALAASGARAAARDPALADLARREQDAQSQISALYGALTVQYDLPPAARKAGVIARLRARIDSLRGARAALAEEIERRFPAYADLVNPKPATVAQVRRVLGRNEALIATYVGARESYVWAVPKTGQVAFAVVPLGRDGIGAAVHQLRRALDPQATTLGEIPAFDVAGAYRLYKALLAPVESGWKDAKSLLVVAHDALGQLPFSVLVTSPRQPGPEKAPLFSHYRDVDFLVRSHAVTVLPSVAALSTLRALPPASAGRRDFAGFGDPLFSTAQAKRAAAAGRETNTAIASRGLFAVRGMPVHLRAAPRLRGVSSADLAKLPRLPDTADEVTGIALALNADLARDVFTGRRASEGRVKSMTLSGYRVIAFATHGLVPGDLDGLTQPALALSSPKVAGGRDDGLLTMGEVLGLRLDADWVVLSACNTASGNGAGAEAISGLGRAFFYAGTRALLVSNWPVETTSARTLTIDIFRRQGSDRTLRRAEALRQSMLALIDGPGFRDTTGRTLFSYAHPIFWAPFSLVGDGGTGGPASPAG